MQQQNQAIITQQDVDVIKDMGLEGLSVDDQEKLLSKISEVVWERSLLRLVENLTEQEAEELNNLLDREEDTKKIDDYLKEKTPDFATILKEEIIKYHEQATKDAEQ